MVVLVRDPSSASMIWYNTKFMVDVGAVHSINNEVESDVFTIMASGGGPEWMDSNIMLNAYIIL